MSSNGVRYWKYFIKHLWEITCLHYYDKWDVWKITALTILSLIASFCWDENTVAWAAALLALSQNTQAVGLGRIKSHLYLKGYLSAAGSSLNIFFVYQQSKFRAQHSLTRIIMMMKDSRSVCQWTDLFSVVCQPCSADTYIYIRLFVLSCLFHFLFKKGCSMKSSNVYM